MINILSNNCYSCDMDKEQHQLIYDVAIVGGGIAGIAAATELCTRPGLSWVICEAGSRLGGRIDSVFVDGRRVDTGAYQFAIMDRGKKPNFLYQSIQNGLCQLDYRQKLNKVYYYDESGTNFQQKDLKKIQKKLKQLQQSTRKQLQTKQSLNARQCIDKFIKQGNLTDCSQQEQRLFQLLLEMQAQEQGTDIENLDADYLLLGDQEQDECQLDVYPLPAITYHGVVEKLVGGISGKGNIMLNTRVIKINRLNDLTQISYQELKDGKVQKNIIKAKYVICALPLQKLKQNIIEFQPKIPEPHSMVIDNMGIGYMQKIILAFSQPFWAQDTQRLKIACKNKQKFLHFSNLSGPKHNSTQQAHILCCYITGKYSQNLLSTHTDSQILQKITKYLNQLFPAPKYPPIQITDHHITRWQNKQDIGYAFSYLPEKLKMKVTVQIRKPIDGWLWFVGEYCYPENCGCAHGAYHTGVAAARELKSRVG